MDSAFFLFDKIRLLVSETYSNTFCIDKITVLIAVLIQNATQPIRVRGLNVLLSFIHWLILVVGVVDVVVSVLFNLQLLLAQETVDVLAGVGNN